MKSSLKRKFLIVLFILFFINILFIITVFTFIKYVEKDGYILDIAGKQRMLIQHIAKDSLLVSQGYDEYREHAIRAMNTFNHTLNVLMNGGKIVYEGREIYIPPPDEEVVEQLTIVQKLWNAYAKEVENVLNNPRENHKEALEYIIKNNEILLVEMDKAVKLLNKEYREKILFLGSIYIFLFLLSLLIYIAIWKIVNKNILVPLEVLKKDAREIASGNIHHKLNIPNTGDEIEDVAKSIESMINSLKKINIELREAYNRLMELDFLKASIIANVSHELKTPISVIKTLVEILMKEEKDKRKLEDFKVIKRNITRLYNLVEDLIVISKVAAGKSELKLETVNIEEIIKDAVVEKEKLAKTKNIKIFADIKPAEIVCDKKLLYRAIINLLDNAIKFNRKNGKVYIKTFKENGYIIIEIKDTGIGIPKDKIDFIFEPLIQLDPSTRRKYGGTGLGLALVKKVIEMHKGTIDVKSEVGKGTEFKIKIPKTLSQ